jgi:hypothetical protein
MRVPIHRSPFPPNQFGGCDAIVSTGLMNEINLVGSLGGETSAKPAKSPMMSVPFCWPGPLPSSNSKNQNDSRIGFL